MNPHTVLTVAGFYFLVFLIPLALAALYFRPDAWHLLLAFCLGVVVGFIDMHSTEPQLAAALLLLFGLFLGFARPSQAWLWGILLACWIPVGSFVTIFATGRSNVLIPDGVGSLLSFAFSFAGSYLGVLFARLARPA